MKWYLNHNGTILPASNLLFGAANRGFRFGDAVFETMKAEAGTIPLFDLHLKRLSEACKVLEYNLPENFNNRYISDNIYALLDTNRLQHARIRFTVYRGEGAFHEINQAASYLIETFPLHKTHDEPVAIGIYNGVKKSSGLLSSYKTANCLPGIMAKIYAEKNGYDDSLYLNEYGRICESSVSNIFWKEKKQLYTPPLSEGPVGGVMRQHLINTSLLEGTPIQEEILTIERLYEADEVFLTNAIRGKIKVKSIEKKSFQ